MRTPAIVAAILIALGLAGALFVRKPPPPPVPSATATPATVPAGASPDEIQSLIQDGQELLSAPPAAMRGQRLAKRVRRARHAGKPVESARTAWKQVHDDARWLLAWIDAGWATPWRASPTRAATSTRSRRCRWISRRSAAPSPRA